MLRKSVGYTFGLIALYVVTINASNFGKVITSGANGGEGVIKTLQGR